MTNPTSSQEALAHAHLLAQLAERCEREGPSRELDALIQAAAFPAWVCKCFASYDDYDERPFSEKVASISESGPSLGGLAYNHMVPLYTASIDAAVTLARKDAWKETTGPRRYLNIPSPTPNYWHCEITTWAPLHMAHGWGATEALAICAAALRAKAHEATANSKDLAHRQAVP